MDSIRFKTHFFICNGKKCSAKADTEAAKKYFKLAIAKRGLNSEVRACSCSCIDYCEEGPNIAVYPAGKIYKGVKQEEWDGILTENLD